MKYLLDTNICVFVIRGRSPLVLQRFVTHLPDQLAISSVTLGDSRITPAAHVVESGLRRFVR